MPDEVVYFKVRPHLSTSPLAISPTQQEVKSIPLDLDALACYSITMDQENQETKIYQLTVLFPPSISTEEKSLEKEEKVTRTEGNQEQLTKAKQKIKQKIIDLGGVILEESSSTPILKKLAYLIKKQAEAFCLTLTFELPIQKIHQLDQFLKEQKEIIRYLINKKKEAKEKPGTAAPLDSKIIDKVEPLSDTPAQKTPPISFDGKPAPSEAGTKKGEKEKVDIKELDKKLEEILNQ